MTHSTHRNICPKCQSPIPADAPGGLCPKCVMANAGTTAGPLPQPSDTPRIEQLAPLFPQLELIELIGRGGMGFVFKARQLHLDREVALKLLSAPLGLDAHFADRFTREARVLARLNHPNIVMVHDFGSAGGYHYLIMEYVDGLNLRQAMRMGKFSPAEALSIVPRICDALQYAHEEGVLHRDIKPENLLLDSRGRVKIADFGIAKIVREDHAAATLTGTGATLGTPHYMAPEQFENPAEVDHRADIYSLGVVFYEMLTGELPIGRFQAPSSRTELDERVDAIVLRALARERELRQKDARELQTEVEQVRATPGVAARAEAVQGTRSPKGVSLWGRVGLIRRRSVWTKVATAALLVLFGFFLAVKMMPRRYYLGPETADDLRSQVEVLSDGPGENPPPLFLTNSPVALDETAKRQEGEIRDARERYEAAKERHSKGEISSRDLALADRDLAVAEARGDEIKSALAQYRFAEWDFRDASLAQETDRIRKAETEMNKAQYALELARAGSNELDRKLAELKHAERAWGSAQRWKARGDISEDEARKLQNNYFYAELEYKRMRENLQNQADRKF